MNAIPDDPTTKIRVCCRRCRNTSPRWRPAAGRIAAPSPPLPRPDRRLTPYLEALDAVHAATPQLQQSAAGRPAPAVDGGSWPSRSATSASSARSAAAAWASSTRRCSSRSAGGWPSRCCRSPRPSTPAAAALQERGPGGGPAAPHQHRAGLRASAASAASTTTPCSSSRARPWPRSIRRAAARPPGRTRRPGRSAAGPPTTADRGRLPVRALPVAGSAARPCRPRSRPSGPPGAGVLPHGRPAGRPGGRGAGPRPPAGRRPPRHQAGQPAARRPAATLWVTDFGLAQLPGRRRPDHDRRPGRHAALHEPRAGRWPARLDRPPHRRLLARRDALRAADPAGRSSTARDRRSCCARSSTRSRARRGAIDRPSRRSWRRSS